MLSRCFLDFSVGVGAFQCHRTESDLFLFHLINRTRKRIPYTEHSFHQKYLNTGAAISVKGVILIYNG